ncbi:MAG: DUF4442 domain-containing protein [Chloroflexota bacterium]|nr:MAG: DUF4442 domain-containing protein [Chloroflexota bacterium]
MDHPNSFTAEGSKPESWRTRLMRWYFNVFPAYRGSGAWVTSIAGDWSEVRIRLPLNWNTRNYVGTIFGGSMYSAVDPMFMIMLIKRLGPGYIVWDKAASIQFKRPGRETLYAVFKIAEGDIEAIRATLETQPKIDCVYTVDLVDSRGVPHATVEKTINIRKKKIPEIG